MWCPYTILRTAYKNISSFGCVSGGPQTKLQWFLAQRLLRRLKNMPASSVWNLEAHMCSWHREMNNGLADLGLPCTNPAKGGEQRDPR